MHLNSDQVEELLTIIKETHLHFIAENIGVDILPKQDIDFLYERGIDIKNFTSTPTVETAFKFGILSMSLQDAENKNLTFDQLKKQLFNSRNIPLTKIEKNALESVKHQSLKDIKGLGNKISSETHQILIDVDQAKRKKYEKIIKEEASKTIANRETLQDFVSRLGHKTGDWDRDLGRIGDYILHTAFDHGRAIAIKQKDGDDTLVYKDVYPGACKHCIRLLTTQGLGSKPKILKISTLTNNGNNIGRKTIDWQAVLGPIHPWCRCTLRKVPKNRIWNDETKDFSDYIKEEVKSRPKIRVDIGGVTKKV